MRRVVVLPLLSSLGVIAGSALIVTALVLFAFLSAPTH
jgi:hypothetical protein